MSDVGEAVLHLAAEADHAAGELRGVADDEVVVVVAVIAVIFAAFSLNVDLAEDFQQVILNLFSFSREKAVEVVLVIIEMVSDEL